MTYISQHIMSFVWVVVWFAALFSTIASILPEYKKRPYDPVIAAASWAIIIVFWFN